MKLAKVFSCLSLCCVMAAVLVAPAAAQDMTAKEVIKKHIKALGGRAKLEGVKSASYTGTMVIPSPMGEMEADVEILQKNKKFLMVMNLSTPQGDMEIKSGSDGDTVWSIQPGMGPKVLDGDEKSSSVEMYGQAFPALGWEKFDGEIKNKGVKKIDDKECYELEFKPKKGPTITRFFDKESGHVVKTATVQNNPQFGDIETEFVHSDYKTIEGIQIPFKQINKTKTPMGPMEMIMEMDEVKLNAKIDDSKFALPEEIKEMVDEKKKEGDGK